GDRVLHCRCNSGDGGVQLCLGLSTAAPVAASVTASSSRTACVLAPDIRISTARCAGHFRSLDGGSNCFVRLDGGGGFSWFSTVSRALVATFQSRGIGMVDRAKTNRRCRDSDMQIQL
ncbi:hypothetical protein EJB05_07344, partial [Eragrostis curvula]